MIRFALAFLPAAALAASYSARIETVDGVEVARLADSGRGMEISIVPSGGNLAYSFKVNGTDILSCPFSSPAEYKRHPVMCGIPFMAPWTNGVRDAFLANGKRYVLNNALLQTGEGPLRGLVMFTDRWKVVSISSDDRSASLVSRLEFWRFPNWMAQFPFAHTITMTYRLADGALDVETAIENQSADPMPVLIGFHPYFRIADAPRSGWTLHIPAREIMPAPDGMPSGQRTPMSSPGPFRLGNAAISNIFTALVAGEDGQAHFWLRGASQKIDVAFGQKFQVAVAYSPPDGNYLNLEPLTGIGNAFELSHKGLYKDLQVIPSGGSWKESFRVTPAGF